MSKLDKKDTLRTAWNIITSGAEWPFLPEVAVIPGRRFRVDWYSETLKLAIEVEGMVYGGRGGHQTVSGYESNCEKYNLLTVLGVRLLRYTPKQIQSDPHAVISQILEVASQ